MFVTFETLALSDKMEGYIIRKGTPAGLDRFISLSHDELARMYN